MYDKREHTVLKNIFLNKISILPITIKDNQAENSCFKVLTFSPPSSVNWSKHLYATSDNQTNAVKRSKELTWCKSKSVLA